MSQALAKFTRRVPELAEIHDGVTLYAGGDDVLCILSMPKALDFAQAISEAYRDAFSDADDLPNATLSAAVVFAQARLPLNQVLGEAHRLLDDVAKDGNGRNSLAVAVLKPSGLHCQWVTTWVRHASDGDESAVDLIRRLEHRIGTAAAVPGVSSALIYRIRDLLSRLCGWEQWRPGDWGEFPSDIDIRAFLRAELHHSLDVRMDNGAGGHADELATKVWDLLGRSRNIRADAANAQTRPDGDGATTQAGVDALLLARFLADPGEVAEQGEPDE